MDTSAGSQGLLPGICRRWCPGPLCACASRPLPCLFWCSLPLCLPAVRPEAAPLAFECLSVVCANPRALSGESYLPLLETCLQYLERYKQQSVEAAVQYLDLVETLFNWLVTQSQRPAAAAAGGGGGGVDEEAALSGEWPTDWLQGRLAAGPAGCRAGWLA